MSNLQYELIAVQFVIPMDLEQKVSYIKIVKQYGLIEKLAEIN